MITKTKILGLIVVWAIGIIQVTVVNATTPTTTKTSAGAEPDTIVSEISLSQELTKKAEGGDPVAMHDLAWLTIMNDGVELFKKNNNVILTLTKKSAESKYPPSIMDLGDIYFYGQYGESKDVERGKKLYAEALQMLTSKTEAELKADSNIPLAIGLAYYFGKGTEINYDEALKYLQLAADCNNALASYWLGKYYSPDDNNTHSDEEKYLAYMKQAAEKGNLAWAMLSLGKWYQKLNDYAEAAKWLQMAADKSNYNGRMDLAGMYLTGKPGLEKDIYKAIGLYEMEASKDEKIYPIDGLAICYIEIGDLEKARDLYDKLNKLTNYDSRYYDKLNRVYSMLYEQNKAENARKRAQEREQIAAKLYKSMDFVGRPLGAIDVLNDAGYISKLEKVWDGYSGAIFNMTLKDGAKYRIEINKNAIVTKARKIK